MDYFIVELIDQVKLAIPLTQVKEVISVTNSDICPIPGVKPAVVGMTNQRGNLLWLLDLSLLVSQMSSLTNQLNSAKVIITQFPEHRLGLMVSKLEEISNLDPNVNNGSQKSELGNVDYYSGIAQRNEKPIPIIDLEKINSYLNTPV